MSRKIEFKIGKDKRSGLVGILFSQPEQQLIMPAENALEMAKQLILAAKECAEEKVLRTMIREIEKEVKN